MRKSNLRKILALSISAATILSFGGCSSVSESVEYVADVILEDLEGEGGGTQPAADTSPETVFSGGGSTAGGGGASSGVSTPDGYTVVAPTREVFDYSTVSAYSGEPAVEINGGTPFFTASDWESAKKNNEQYGEFDSLGRCTGCMALVSLSTMPTEERGEIGQIKPTGWHTVKYSFISGNYLYNRCHLIGYQMTGENDNPLNLVTGTRYMNVAGQLPYEDEITYYVQTTNDPVLYRVTPIFIGDELVCRGVLTEASNESGTFGCCVFCYNVQPGVEIDYATGDSWESGDFTGADYSDPFYD